MKIKQPIDWQRISNAILQQDKTLSKHHLEEIGEKFALLVDILGDYSLVRPMITKICHHIALKGYIDVIVPVCPDYSHENGIYTLESVQSNLSLVAQKHIEFLKTINDVFKISALFLFADYEVEDEFLRNKMGLSKDQFLGRIRSSSSKCYEVIRELGFNWLSSMMTDVLESIEQKEEIYISMISNAEYVKQIAYDTVKREVLYNKINPNFTWEQKVKRTIKTAAQYYMLGLYAKSHNSLICNHTTTNLSWYVKSGAGILHNPVVIY